MNSVCGAVGVAFRGVGARHRGHVDLRYGAGDRPLAVAHRGGAGLAPENTLAAFSLAFGLGLRYLETDVRLTADGVALAFHDETLVRVTGARGRVRDRPWDDVARLLVQGREPVARLEDVLGSFPDSCVTVDLKEAAAIAPLAAAIRRTGSASRVCVAGAWDGWLAAVRTAVGPALATALGWRSLTALVTCARVGVRPPRSLATGAFVHLPLRLGRVPVLGERLVAMSHDLGVRVLAWTVDDPTVMHGLLDDGVDGLITDRPDLLREVLVRRGAWSPATGASAVIRRRQHRPAARGG